MGLVSPATRCAGRCEATRALDLYAPAAPGLVGAPMRQLYARGMRGGSLQFVQRGMVRRPWRGLLEVHLSWVSFLLSQALSFPRGIEMHECRLLRCTNRQARISMLAAGLAFAGPFGRMLLDKHKSYSTKLMVWLRNLVPETNEKVRGATMLNQILFAMHSAW